MKKTLRPMALFIAASLSAMSLAAIASPAHAAEPDRVLHFLVDVSGSMATNDRIGAAKAAVSSVVEDLDEATTGAGLRTFGVVGCDTALNVQPGPLDKEAFLAAVSPLAARGSTPLAAGLAAAAEDLRTVAASEKSIVLLADGDNNCGGDPCQVARDIAAAGTDLVVHTAGIQVDGTAQQTLECIANATGGSYVDVEDPDDLEDLLNDVVTGQLVKTVVLGDSYSSGEGAYLYDQNTDCHRGSESWGGWLESTYTGRIDVVANYACSGAKIGDLNENVYRGQVPQLDQLRNAIQGGMEVEMVMFTIGGNDAMFGDIIRDCFLKNGPVSCAGRVKSVSATADAIKSRVQKEILPELRSIVGPDVDIVWVGYPRLFPSSQELVTECWWLSDAERRGVNNGVAALSIRGFDFDDETDAHFVGSYPVFDGGELCADTSYFNPVLGKPSKFAPEQAHPTSDGYRVWADYIYDQLKAKGVL